MLRKVCVDLDKNMDMNGNGKSNCEDAAILFYKYYPYKDDVCIMVNNHGTMNHAFNVIRVNGAWIGVEPQSYHTGWRNTYSMHDHWGSKYNAVYNVNKTDYYKQFAR